MSDRQRLVAALLERHGRTFAAELGADIGRNTPSPLFRLLCLSLLTSAPVQADIAMKAAQALGGAPAGPHHRKCATAAGERESGR